MTHKIVFLALSFFIMYAGSAQSTLSEQDSIIKSAADKNNKIKLSSPFGASSLPNLFSHVSISSFFKEGVNGKIELQGKFGSRLSGGISIDQKIGGGDEEAMPLDLTGISPGTTVEFNLQKIFWKPQFNLSVAEIKALGDVEQAYASRNKIADVRTVGLREISLNGTPEEKKMALAAFKTISFKEPVYLNASFGFTKTSFSYTTDSVTLKQNSEAYITPTFTISVIKTLGNGFGVNGYVALSYNYSEYYDGAGEVTFNIPFGTTRNYYTSTVAFGKPEKSTSNNIIVELRQNIFAKKKENGYSNVAISPSVTLGIDSKTLSVFLPVYLIRGSDDKGKLMDGLQGGIRFGYITSTESGQVSSFKNGFIAQLIISQPLDFLSQL